MHQPQRRARKTAIRPELVRHPTRRSPAEQDPATSRRRRRRPSKASRRPPSAAILQGLCPNPRLNSTARSENGTGTITARTSLERSAAKARKPTATPRRPTAHRICGARTCGSASSSTRRGEVAAISTQTSTRGTPGSVGQARWINLESSTMTFLLHSFRGGVSAVKKLGSGTIQGYLFAEDEYRLDPAVNIGDNADIGKIRHIPVIIRETAISTSPSFPGSWSSSRFPSRTGNCMGTGGTLRLG